MVSTVGFDPPLVAPLSMMVDAGGDGVDESGAGALIPAVVAETMRMCDVADERWWDTSCPFLYPGEIAEVENAELAPGDKGTEGAGILGLIGGAGGESLQKGWAGQAPGSGWSMKLPSAVRTKAWKSREWEAGRRAWRRCGRIFRWQGLFDSQRRHRRWVCHRVRESGPWSMNVPTGMRSTSVGGTPPVWSTW